MLRATTLVGEGLGGNNLYVTASGTTKIKHTDLYVECDTTSNAMTIQLPDDPHDKEMHWINLGPNALTNNVTLTGGSLNINDVSGNYTGDTNHTTTLVKWSEDQSTWLASDFTKTATP